MEYLTETKKAMNWLAKQKDTYFLGQTVEYEGSPMYRSLVEVDKKKRLEMPVAEDMQMGISTGLALNGFVPISIYPRMDFLIIAMNQLVNHLDKVEEMSHGEWKAGVIIRTQIGNTKPLYPGPQHTGNYYQMLKAGLKNVRVFKVEEGNFIRESCPKDKKDYNHEGIIGFYKEAYRFAKMGISTILIETPQGGKDPNKK